MGIQERRLRKECVMEYWFHWINEEMSEQPNVVGAPKAIEADTPGEA